MARTHPSVVGVLAEENSDPSLISGRRFLPIWLQFHSEIYIFFFFWCLRESEHAFYGGGPQFHTQIKKHIPLPLYSPVSSSVMLMCFEYAPRSNCHHPHQLTCMTLERNGRSRAGGQWVL